MLLAIGTEKRRFTLIELICVLAISLLLLGIVVNRVGKTPLFLSLNKVSLDIQNLMSTASKQAELNGKVVVITYDNRTFLPDSSNSFGNSNYRKYLQLELPKDVEVEFLYLNGQSLYPPKFNFYPDGMASGPDIVLSLKAQRIVIHISKLTGQPVVTSK